MGKDLALLVEAVGIAADYNQSNPKDVIRIEALTAGVRIWIVFQATNGQNYTTENLTSWRALHQAPARRNPLATALDTLIKERMDFNP